MGSLSPYNYTVKALVLSIKLWQQPPGAVLTVLTAALFSDSLFTMVHLLIFAGLISGLASPGFLSVSSQPAGMPVFIEGDSVGTAPVVRYQLEPGNYWVTVVSNDSLERLYQTVRTGALGRRLAALWALARIDAASTRVEILPAMETKVEISARTMEQSACRAKWLLGGSVFGLFGLGVITGLVVGLTAN